MAFLETLSGLSVLTLPVIAAAAAIFARISALTFFLPGLGEQFVSVRVRLGAALAITFVVLPTVIGSAPAPETVSQAAAMIAAEAVSGALIGFSIRIAIYALQTAGAIISQSLSLSQLFGSTVELQPESPISTILMIAGIVLIVSTGLHFEVIRVLILTFDYMPLGVFPGVSDTGQWAADRAAYAFAAALSLALPFVALGFVYNMAIGAANRAMPQLMVAFVGIPAVTLAGLVLLALSAPIILNAWIGMVDAILTTLSGG